MVFKDDPSGTLVMSVPVGMDEYFRRYLAHLNILGTQELKNFELAYPGLYVHRGTVHIEKEYGRGGILYNIADGYLDKQFGFVYDWWSHDFNHDSHDYKILQPNPGTQEMHLVCDTGADYWTYTQGSESYSHDIILKDWMLKDTRPYSYNGYSSPYMVGWRNNVWDARAMVGLHIRIHKNYYSEMMENYGLWFVTPRSYRFQDFNHYDRFMGMPDNLIGSRFFRAFKYANTTLPNVYPNEGASLTIIPAYTEPRDTYHDYFVFTAVDLPKRDVSDALNGDKNDSCRAISFPGLAVKGDLPEFGKISVVDGFISIHSW